MWVGDKDDIYTIKNGLKSIQKKKAKEVVGVFLLLLSVCCKLKLLSQSKSQMNV